MSKTSIRVMAGLVLLSLCAIGAAASADAKPPKPANFPRKPVTLQVSWVPGGGSDLMCRALASGARPYVGQAVVVVNRDGAGGTIGHAEMAAANPDGYLVGMTTSGTFTTQPLLREVEYSIDDFDFLMGMTREAMGLYVPASLDVDSVAEFKEKLKDREIIVGAHAAGSIPAFSAADVFPKIGLPFSVINYGGSGEVLPALLGEHIHVGFMHPHEAQSNMEAGTIKCIGIATEERLPDYPDIPTFREQGIDWVAAIYKGLIMPKGGDPAVVAFLSQAFIDAMESPEFLDYARKNNAQVFVTDGATLRANIAAQAEVFKKLAAESGK